jgi:methyl-accepting chemotaxis protein
MSKELFEAVETLEEEIENIAEQMRQQTIIIKEIAKERDAWRRIADQLALGAEDYLNEGMYYQLKKGLDMFNEAIK